MEEKVFTINLRKESLKVNRHQRANRSSSAIREYLERHMKADEVKIGESINQKIWSHGNQNPPNKIKIKAVKTDEGVVRAEAWGNVSEEKVEKEVKEEKSEEKTKKKKSTNK
jgi:large subunit ribosomal protein L31e